MRRTFLVLFAFLAISVFSGIALSQTRTESFWRKLLRITGIAAAPSPKGGVEIKVGTGDLFVFNLERGSSIQISSGGGYRSPVFLLSDQSILALKGDSIVELPLTGGKPRVLFSRKGIAKLVGINTANADQVLVLGVDEQTVGLLSLKSGKLIRLPYNKNSKEDAKMLEHLQDWDRVYDKVQVFNSPSRNDAANSSDVYIKRSGEDQVNLSECGPVRCGQPSLSHSGKLVVFIKETR